MATVNVTSWAEFLSAVAVAGDTVVLPEGATWDMNSICPEGYHNDIPVSCAEIDGNGTTIKNLHLYGKFVVNNALTIDSLYLKNIVSESDHLIDKGSSTRTVTMHGCILTGISGLQNRCVIEGPLTVTSSTISFDMTASGYGAMYFVFNTFRALYSRISIKYPLSSSTLELSAGYAGIKFCMVNIDAPGVTAIESYTFSGCVVTGNMTNASDTHGYYTPGYVSVYDVAAFDEEFEPDTEYFKPVTQSQLCDAQYLASIGFPIGPIGA